MIRHVRPVLIFIGGAAVGAAWMLGMVLFDLDLDIDDDIWEG